MGAPSLALFKAKLDGALSNLTWGKVSLPMAGRWNGEIFKVLSNTRYSMMTVKY